MKAKYLSHNAARALAADYQHLVGKPFGPTHTIQMVVTGPYSRILQWGHVSALLRGKPTPPNPKNRYDALVVALDASSPAGFLIQDLRSFLEKSGVSYDLAPYKNARTAAGMI